MSIKIKRPEKVVPLCLDADLRAAWEAKVAELDQVKKVPAERLTGNAEATRLAGEVQGIEREMLGQVVRFRLRGLPRNVWAGLVTAHPVRDGNTGDRQFGVNTETFFDAVMGYSEGGVSTVVEVTQDDGPVEFDAGTEWLPLAEDMTNGQYAGFVDALVEINRAAVSVPFSRAAASLASPRSSETSK